MQCPVDGETLVMTERSGVEIDYCPKCRGVWLDRGELDKIIDRAAPADDARPVVMAPPGAAPVPQQPFAQHPHPQPPKPASHPAAAPDLHGQPPFGNDPADRRYRDDDRYRDRDRDGRRRHRDDDDDDYRYRKGKKRESFLSELFDF